MKRYLFSFTFLLASSTGWPQENLISISGGYAFANGEDFEDQATGWRIMHFKNSILKKSNLLMGCFNLHKNSSL